MLAYLYAEINLAVLGGGHWKETATLAEEFPQAFFDLCEIIEWVGAPEAPSWEELSALVRAIGPERVMMGSDFPWYDLDRTVEVVDQLEGLSAREKEMIMGENAVRATLILANLVSQGYPFKAVRPPQ